MAWQRVPEPVERVRRRGDDIAPIDGQQHDGAGAGVPREVVEELQRVLVGRVGVVDGQQHGRPRGGIAEQGRRRPEHRPALLAWVAVPGPPGQGDRVRLVRALPLGEVALEGLAEGLVGQPPLSLVGRAGEDSQALGGGEPKRLGGQPGLADTQLAGDPEHPAVAAVSPHQRTADTGELKLAPHKWWRTLCRLDKWRRRGLVGRGGPRHRRLKDPRVERLGRLLGGASSSSASTSTQAWYWRRASWRWPASAYTCISSR